MEIAKPNPHRVTGKLKEVVWDGTSVELRIDGVGFVYLVTSPQQIERWKQAKGSTVFVQVGVARDTEV